MLPDAVSTATAMPEMEASILCKLLRNKNFGIDPPFLFRRGKATPACARQGEGGVTERVDASDRYALPSEGMDVRLSGVMRIGVQGRRKSSSTVTAHNENGRRLPPPVSVVLLLSA